MGVLELEGCPVIVLEFSNQKISFFNQSPHFDNYLPFLFFLVVQGMVIVSLESQDPQ